MVRCTQVCDLYGPWVRTYKVPRERERLQLSRLGLQELSFVPTVEGTAQRDHSEQGTDVNWCVFPATATLKPCPTAYNPPSNDRVYWLVKVFKFDFTSVSSYEWPGKVACYRKEIAQLWPIS